MERSKYMKISEVSRLTNTPKSTIRYYINQELLPPPIKTGKTMAYYSKEHVERLQLIKKILNEENIPLRFLKELLNKEQEKYDQRSEAFSDPRGRREDIINNAIMLFRKKGYFDTTISDIVEHAKIGRGTFYLHFKNKQELFVECTDRIFYTMYDDVWNEIKDEKNMEQRLIKRARAFYRSYPQWQDMMNLLRAAAIADSEAFAGKLDKVMHQIIDPIIRDLRNGKELGNFRDFDETLVGFVVMGMAEYLAYYIHHNEIKNLEAKISALNDILYYGIKKT